MKQFNYTLEPYRGMKTKYNCPVCGKRTFTRYILSENKTYLGSEFGRCDREINCGYSRKPDIEKYEYSAPIPIIKTMSTIHSDYIKISMQKYENNNFVTFLMSLFDEKKVIHLIEKYKIGTSKYWENSTIFWQVDYYGKVRTGKIMQYEKGKRVKGKIHWVHSLLRFKDYQLTQCLFGEHLLFNDTLSKVAVVESEKTAIICSVHYPEYIWLATGGLQNISQEKFNILKHKDVVFIPDLKCFDKWVEKVEKLKCNKKFRVSNCLELIANDEQKEKGLDLCDFILNRINIEI